MSKKKKRHYKRMQKMYGYNAPIAKDLHHILWTRKTWSQGYCYTLRNFWYCKIDLLVGEHRQIHKKIGAIPLPSNVNAKSAYEQLQMLDKYGVLHEDDCLEKRVKLIASLFDCVEQRTADAIRRQI